MTSRVRRSQPPFSLWRNFHYDVIHYWAGDAQRYGPTYGHLTAFNIIKILPVTVTTRLEKLQVQAKKKNNPRQLSVEVYLRSRWRRTEEEPTDPGSAGKKWSLKRSCLMVVEEEHTKTAVRKESEDSSRAVQWSDRIPAQLGHSQVTKAARQVIS